MILVASLIYFAFLLWKPVLLIHSLSWDSEVSRITLTDSLWVSTMYFVVENVTSSLVYALNIRLISVWYTLSSLVDCVFISTPHPIVSTGAYSYPLIFTINAHYFSQFLGYLTYGVLTSAIGNVREINVDFDLLLIIGGKLDIYGAFSYSITIGAALLFAINWNNLIIN